MKYPRCCNKDPMYMITYDCGPEPNQTILVCKDHYSDEAFHRFVIKIAKLEE
ncbi:MAG: hypothetical protein O6761_03350 [Thaumarchaeota archaeon]|nr:hypothetical protein [Nitrososphaerota archaeon]